MNSKEHDIRMSNILSGLAAQMVDPEDTSPGSHDLSTAVSNTLSALVTLMQKYERIDPIIILGSLEVAKAMLLHSLHEAITLDRLENGR